MVVGRLTHCWQLAVGILGGSPTVLLGTCNVRLGARLAGTVFCSGAQGVTSRGLQLGVWRLAHCALWISALKGVACAS